MANRIPVCNPPRFSVHASLHNPTAGTINSNGWGGDCTNEGEPLSSALTKLTIKEENLRFPLVNTETHAQLTLTFLPLFKHRDSTSALINSYLQEERAFREKIRQVLCKRKYSHSSVVLSSTQDARELLLYDTSDHWHIHSSSEETVETHAWVRQQCVLLLSHGCYTSWDKDPLSGSVVWVILSPPKLINWY